MSRAMNEYKMQRVKYEYMRKRPVNNTIIQKMCKNVAITCITQIITDIPGFKAKEALWRKLPGNRPYNLFWQNRDL